MKSFALILLIATSAFAERLSLPLPADAATNALFNPLQSSKNALHAMVKKLLGNRTGVFSGNCSVFFGNSIESAACDINPIMPQNSTESRQGLAGKVLPEDYWSQILVSNILLATIYADWSSNTRKQSYDTDVYNKISPCTDSVSESLSLSNTAVPTKSASNSAENSRTNSLTTDISNTDSHSADSSHSWSQRISNSFSHAVSATHSLLASLSKTLSYSFTDSESKTRTASRSHTESATDTRTHTRTASISPVPSLSYSSEKSLSNTLSIDRTSSRSLSFDCSASTPPTTGILSAWHKAGGTYDDDTNQPGRYTISGGVVFDTLTKIQWEQTSSASSMTWAAAATYCAGRTTGGFSGWRAPNIGELQMLIDYTASSPYIDATAFPGAPANSYWSSTSVVGLAGNAWNVQLGSNAYTAYDNTATTNYVRCVRSCYQLPSVSRYTASSGEVTDSVTGLIWQQASPTTGGPNSDGTYQASGAVTYCSGLGLNGHTWRSPKIKELASLLNYNVTQNSFMIDPIFTGALNSYWTSTPMSLNPTGGWIVYFGLGRMNDVNGLYSVRCVR
jgi:hypothetical protein